MNIKCKVGESSQYISFPKSIIYTCISQNSLKSLWFITYSSSHRTVELTFFLALQHFNMKSYFDAIHKKGNKVESFSCAWSPSAFILMSDLAISAIKRKY